MSLRAPRHPEAEQAVVLEPAAYDRWFATPLGQRVWRDESRAIRALLRDTPGSTVLDAGCGDGRLSVELARGGAHVIGLDHSEAMLAAAKTRAARCAVPVRLVAGDIRELPFARDGFDRVVVVTVLCFLTSARVAVGELARVLRPGGRLVLAELGRWSEWAAVRRLRGWRGDPLWAGVRFWTSARLRALVREAGLAPVARRGAVFYPRCAPAARLLAPFDPLFGRVTTVGAALVLVAADKPG